MNASDFKQSMKILFQAKRRQINKQQSYIIMIALL